MRFTMKCKFEDDIGFECKENALTATNYCILHLPFPDNKGRVYERILNLKYLKIQEKIKNNDFNFTGAVMHGLNINNKKIDANVIFDSASIRGDLNFKNNRINGRVGFSNVIIHGNVDFRNSLIKDEVNFMLSTFKNGSIFFMDTTIWGKVHFNGANLEGYLDFERSIINNDANFSFEKVGHDAQFKGVTIKGSTNFSNIEVGGYFSLEYAEIGGNIDFQQALFGTSNSTPDGNNSFFTAVNINGEADFMDAEFFGGVEFSKSYFRENTYFLGTIFNEIADFENSRFYENVDFSETKFKKGSNFNNASFLSTGLFKGLNYIISFENARLKNMAFKNCDLTNARFKHVIFENCELSASQWKNEIPEYNDYKKGELDALVVADTYRRIRQCLQKEGVFNEAGEFYIKEMNMKRESFKNNNRGMFALYSLLLITSNYGESLKRIIVCFIALILTFTGIYYAMFNFELSSALSFSAINSIALIYNQPFNGLEWVIFAERLIGTFLTAVLIYAFTRKLSR